MKTEGNKAENSILKEYLENTEQELAFVLQQNQMIERQIKEKEKRIERLRFLLAQTVETTRKQQRHNKEEIKDIFLEQPKTESLNLEESVLKTRNKKKPIKRQSMSQNYKGSVTRGFARSLLEPYEIIPSLEEHLRSQIKECRQYYMNLNQTNEELEAEIKKYLKKNVKGKIAYNTKEDRQADKSKVGSKHAIDEVFIVNDERDKDELLCLTKRVLHNCLLFFLRDEACFQQWINNGCQSD